MNGIDTFIVEFKEQFRGEIKSGDATILLSSIFKDSKQLTKYGRVYFNPIEDPGFKVKTGEYVWFHHNVASSEIVRGPSGAKKMVSQYMVSRAEDLYAVPSDLIYAYTKDGELVTPAPYCFIKPIAKKDKVTKEGGLWMPGDAIPGAKTATKYEQNIGIVECSNPNLEKKGIFKGDTVIFEKDSEYEMIDVHDEPAYRMKESWIYAKIQAS
jgi:hypothetical protein